MSPADEIAHNVEYALCGENRSVIILKQGINRVVPHYVPHGTRESDEDLANNYVTYERKLVGVIDLSKPVESQIKDLAQHFERRG